MPGPESNPPGGNPERERRATAAAPPPRRSGVRLGPMVFVPEFRHTGARDPWAHRKGEPRPFALLWAIYLMAAALLTIFAVSRISIPSTAQFVYACRAMLVMANLGVVVLWPMTRLSQQFPQRPVRAVLVDLLIVLVPVQAVVWPMPVLAHWSWPVTAAQAASTAAWAMLVASILLVAMRHPTHWGRTISMLACLGVALIGPALLIIPIVLNRPASADLILWLSPLTTPYIISAAPSGHSPSMLRSEWLLTLAPLPLALGLSLFADPGDRNGVSAPPVDPARPGR